MKRSLQYLALAAVSAIAFAQAPDATGTGPYTVATADYKLPAAVDPEVSSEIATELWARIYKPSTLSGTHPLLVFLHGNHATCGRDAGAGPYRYDTSVLYSSTGFCPVGYVPVPNHLGYSYVAEKLASWGYIVVSINANRGVNTSPGLSWDRGLNLRRGRLVLKHLWLLSQWNLIGTSPGLPSEFADLAASLQGKLNFSEVGMMGHSRGGEGVRAAYNIYRNPSTDDPPGIVPPPYTTDWQTKIGTPVTFHAIFEIGPVDGQTFQILNADGTAWSVLLPMCDGDVSNLQGVRPFDRMMLQTSESPARIKSTFTVWGTNHNFYNTEWQVSDSPGCLGHKRQFEHLGGSAVQRSVSTAAIMAMFRGSVGATKNPDYLLIFNPEVGLPASIASLTRIDRGYTDSPSTTLTSVYDDFPLTPTNTYSKGGNVSYGFGGVPNHSSQQRAAQIVWRNGGTAGTWVQTSAPASRDVSGFATLDFRVSRQCQDLGCRSLDNGWQLESHFSVQLVGTGGVLSDIVPIRDYISLTGPVGGLVRFAGASPHPILQTVRMPLWRFGNDSILANLTGIRFVFNDTAKDEIYLANVRFSVLTNGVVPTPPAVLPTADSLISENLPPDQNAIKSIQTVRSAAALQGQAGVEIELNSNREFLPKGELLVLQIGAREFSLSRYGDDGDTRRVIFTLTAAEFAQLLNGDPVSVQYGSGTGSNSWRFGKLNKLF